MKTNIRYILGNDNKVKEGLLLRNDGIFLTIRNEFGAELRFSPNTVFDSYLDAMTALRERVQQEVAMETRNAKSAQERASAAISKLIHINIEIFNLKKEQ